MLIIILIFGLMMIILGRIMLQTWLNHLVVYSAIWTLMLTLEELNLIGYIGISTEAWFYMIIAWLILYLASTMVIVFKASHPEARRSLSSAIVLSKIKKNLRAFIILLSLTSLISVIQHWYALYGYFGNIKTILSNGSLIYHLRITGQLSRGIPYLDSLVFAAVCLAGIYNAIINKISALSFLPLTIVLLSSIAIQGRGGLLSSLILYVSSYAIYQKSIVGKIRLKNKKFVNPILIVLIITFFAAEYIRSTREDNNYSYWGQTNAQEKLQNFPFFSISGYLYLSGPPVVFSEYLKAGGEEVYFGQNTFAPIYRILSHLGMKISNPWLDYQKEYYIPLQINTGTYLRELHADFGFLGILVFPFALGVVCTSILLRSRNHLTIMSIVIFSHLMLIIGWSFDVNAMRLGSLWISFIVSSITAFIIQKLSKRNRPCTQLT